MRKWAHVSNVIVLVISRMMGLLTTRLDVIDACCKTKLSDGHTKRPGGVDFTKPFWAWWVSCHRPLCGQENLFGCFLKWWYPQNTPKWSFLVGKPMVVGYQHFRKPPLKCGVYFSFGSLVMFDKSGQSFQPLFSIGWEGSGPALWKVFQESIIFHCIDFPWCQFLYSRNLHLYNWRFDWEIRPIRII